jgi:[ribosomal protein S5]-alanine N-acetyltransferase
MQENSQRKQLPSHFLCAFAPLREVKFMYPIDDLDTARLHLTRIRPADLDDYIRMYADPRVMATLGGLRTAEWTTTYLDVQAAHWDKHGFGLWTARDAATGEFAGRGGLRHGIVDGKAEIELAYGFLPAFWGRGIATELAAECVRVGFTELRLPEIVCFTLPTNAASKRVMEKVGFRYERDIVYCELPHVLCRLTSAEWQV